MKKLILSFFMIFMCSDAWAIHNLWGPRPAIASDIPSLITVPQADPVNPMGSITFPYGVGTSCASAPSIRNTTWDRHAYINNTIPASEWFCIDGGCIKPQLGWRSTRPTPGQPPCNLPIGSVGVSTASYVDYKFLPSAKTGRWPPHDIDVVWRMYPRPQQHIESNNVTGVFKIYANSFQLKGVPTVCNVTVPDNINFGIISNNIGNQSKNANISISCSGNPLTYSLTFASAYGAFDPMNGVLNSNNNTIGYQLLWGTNGIGMQNSPIQINTPHVTNASTNNPNIGFIIKPKIIKHPYKAGQSNSSIRLTVKIN